MPATRPVVYRGELHPGGATVVVASPGSQRPLEHQVRHSPSGLAWGYAGSGPADLARSILADRISWPPPPTVYQRFKRDVVARLSRDGFELSAAQVDGWLERHYPLTRQLADRADDLQVQLVELASQVEEHFHSHGDCTRDQGLAFELAEVADGLGQLASRGRTPALQRPAHPAVERAEPERDDVGLELP